MNQNIRTLIHSTFALICAAFIMASPVMAQNPVKVPGQKTSTTPKKKKPATEKTTSTKKPAAKPETKREKPAAKPTETTHKSTPAVQSRPASFAKGLNQWTSFVLNPNEVIYESEYRSNLKINGSKSVMVLHDTIKNRMSLVLDGNRTINNVGFVQLYFAHPTTLNDIVYSYSTDNGDYMSIQGKTYGPYEEVGELGRGKLWAPYNHYYGTRFHEFFFKQMGKYYHHDVDGTITLLKKQEGSYAPGTYADTFRSPNGKYALKVSSDKRSVSLGGKTYQIVPSTVKESDIYYYATNCYDDGRAVVKIEYNDGSKWNTVRALIYNGNIQYGGENDMLDHRTGRIIPSNDDYDPYADEFFYFDLGWSQKANGQWTMQYDYTLQDTAKKHTFMANWAYDYVLIDGQRINCTSPIDAWYDSVEHAFAWTSLDGRQLRQYVYKL